MPGITVGGASGVTLNYSTTDAVAVATTLATQISADLVNGTYTTFNYTGNGAVAPEPASGSGGVAVFTQPTNGSVFVDGADQSIVINATGPVSVQGGAAGGSLVAGAGAAGAPLNVSYTNITPSGTATDQIAILGGNNLVATATFGTGNYNISTGSGNDSISVSMGNATVNPGTGTNLISLGAGSNLIYSEGYDSVTGAVSGGGSDTVDIGSGQTSINPATSNFLINDGSTNPLLLTLGSGTTTINFGPGASGVINGPNSTATITGVGTVVAHPTSTGDGYTVTGAASANIVAGAANETVVGAGSSGNEVFRAGTGNDTLIAGPGAVVLSGAVGPNATALLQSGGLDPTTFSFVNGQFSGGADTITGFKSSDIISLAGYGPNAVSSEAVSGGSTIIKLADNTTITIANAAPTSGQIRIS